MKNVDLIGVTGSVLIKDIFAVSSYFHTRRHFSLCFFSLPLHMKLIFPFYRSVWKGICN